MPLPPLPCVATGTCWWCGKPGVLCDPGFPSQQVPHRHTCRHCGKSWSVT